MITEHDLRKNGDLILCDKCDNSADWTYSIEVGWVGCAACITGISDEFDDGDLIVNDTRIVVDFLREFNEMGNDK